MKRPSSRVLAIWIGGAAAFAYLVATTLGELTPIQWGAAFALGIAAIAIQRYASRPSDRDSGYLLAAPVFAALILFPSYVASLVVLVAMLAAIGRRPLTWPAQVTQGSAWFVAIGAAYAGRLALQMPADPAAVAADGRTLILLALLVGVTRNGIIALTSGRWLGLDASRGAQQLRLLIESSLVAGGWGIAAAWTVSPLTGIAAAIPLALAYLSAHALAARRDAEDSPLGIVSGEQFNELLVQTVQKVQSGSAGGSVSVLRIDVDELNQINRARGRPLGDAVLQAVAVLVARGHRTSDFVGRLGDDEFGVLLPGTPAAGALRVAERYCQSARQLQVPDPEGGSSASVTISIGFTTFDSGTGPAGDLLAEADLALFQAKVAGRNQVVAFTSGSRQLGVEWAANQAAARSAHIAAVTHEAETAPATATPDVATTREQAAANGSAGDAARTTIDRTLPPTVSAPATNGAAAHAVQAPAAAPGAPERPEAPPTVRVSPIVAAPSPATPPTPRSVPAPPPPAASTTSAAPTPAPVSASRPPDMHPFILGFIATLVLTSLGLTAWDILTSPAFTRWEALVLFAILIVVAEQYAIDIEGRGKTSITVVPIIAVSIVAGAMGALLCALTFAVMAKIRANSPIHRALFNFAVALLAAEGASATFRLMVPNGQVGATAIEYEIVPALAAGLAYYTLNHLPLMVVFGFIQKRSPWSVWHANYRWLWPHYLVMGALGLILALSYQSFGWFGAIAFMSPAAMMHLAIKQYVDRTGANIRQLWGLNKALEDEIAQRKAAEDENARLAQEAARVAAVEELSRIKSEFISIASHELRTPMTAIVGFSELLNDKSITEEQRDRWIYLINRESQNLNALVDSLLDVSRIESGRVTLDLQVLDLAEIARHVGEPIAAATTKHAIALDIRPEAQQILADPAKFTQIITNLISNAVKYSPSGGTVTISSQIHGDGKSIEIAVQDEGIGIPPDQLDRVFERFQRVASSATRNIRGSGLGLYIVKQLVELHGGRIWVTSQPGKGSRFALILPPAPISEVAETASAFAAPAAG